MLGQLTHHVEGGATVGCGLQERPAPHGLGQVTTVHQVHHNPGLPVINGCNIHTKNKSARRQCHTACQQVPMNQGQTAVLPTETGVSSHHAWHCTNDHNPSNLSSGRIYAAARRRYDA